MTTEPPVTADRDVLRRARSVIRDMDHGYAAKELVVTPEEICEQLSGLLGEKYDYSRGEIIDDD